MRLLFLVTLTVAATSLVAQEPAFKNSLGMEFVLIKPGTMQVGVYQPTCPDPNGRGGFGGFGQGRGSGRSTGRGRGPQDPRTAWTPADYAKCEELIKRDAMPGFPVEIRKAYYIGKFEVTQGEWKKVMGTNPSVFQGNRLSDDADNHPVENITWQDTQVFINKLNAREKAKVYRLPTDFEWEYAGRAGGKGQITWAEIRELAVEQLGNTLVATTRPAGSKKPNAWGLYDMLGNVWEWVQDYDNGKMFADPVPPKKGTEHVLKGGGFLADVKNVIYATHGAGPGSGYDVGFRIVREVK